MIYPTLEAFRAAPASAMGKGPFAVIVAEDAIEVEASVMHCLQLGFGRVILLAPDQIALPDHPAEISDKIDVIRHRTRQQGAAQDAVNALIDKVPGQWLHYCYNGEFLFFPFCEDRSIGEAVAFTMEERRNSILTYVIDLYADDLTAYPNGVSLDTAHIDSSGYYAATRRNADDQILERQLNFYGGLRWRFEEHVPEPKRKIDRVGLFQARPGLRLRENHTLNDEEMNTYECPWHHSLSATICSFRVAKALRTNPGSRHDVPDFRWHKSTRFHWSSQQLMQLGLMEPGQWF
ncbi:hypothetical protein GTA62_04215 [Roseobacter sp. HKCCD9010]|uniref:hypothetical protein n=1 Tax=Rhodobacterales TaxID=204455 RepID=UPI0014924B7A|nr:MULTISPECIES: hypothetical protein [Rhodobacterales]MBF9048926.1 hypothetical protein [Rhodobacterales bacterium HKCCD4356]NNV10925.1 hypothetical protein [Roseobacter sp. HKCCD7357]NNV15110.1 hypothetical protein [Roseobacter sp. HKCCD8768]NNV24569.1 hypothetical protein [Roseobacter sp. HKCCD8192]NNV28826.1 hypothetical protein [Roseobacter sp. HKCCD9061]